MGNLSQRCRRKRVPAREGGSVFKFLLDRVDAIIDGVRQLAAAFYLSSVGRAARTKRQQAAALPSRRQFSRKPYSRAPAKRYNRALRKGATLEGEGAAGLVNWDARGHASQNNQGASARGRSGGWGAVAGRPRICGKQAQGDHRPGRPGSGGNRSERDSGVHPIARG